MPTRFESMIMLNYKTCRSLVFLIFAAILTAVYFFIDPSVNTWVPQCPTKLLTGYNCPVCGAQRAFHSLLHGDIKLAWQYNAFLFFAVPLLFFVVLSRYLRLSYNRKLNRIVTSPFSIYVFLGLAVIWGILRNL